MWGTTWGGCWGGEDKEDDERMALNVQPAHATLHITTYKLIKPLSMPSSVRPGLCWMLSAGVLHDITIWTSLTSEM